MSLRTLPAASRHAEDFLTDCLSKAGLPIPDDSQSQNGRFQFSATASRLYDCIRQAPAD
jgi:hypothetical protein